MKDIAEEAQPHDKLQLVLAFSLEQDEMAT
jgi:hypothetical protein